MAKLDYVKDKWISLDLIIQLIRRECSRNEEILNLNDSQIKSYIFKFDGLSHNDTISAMGYYFREKKKRKRLNDGKSQNIKYQGIFITGQRQKPPATDIKWYDSIIIDSPPSWGILPPTHAIPATIPMEQFF